MREFGWPDIEQAYQVRAQLEAFACHRVFVWEDHAVISRSHDDHHRILRTIQDGDAGRAEALMREHIINAGQVLLQSMAGSQRPAPSEEGDGHGRRHPPGP